MNNNINNGNNIKYSIIINFKCEKNKQYKTKNDNVRQGILSYVVGYCR